VRRRSGFADRPLIASSAQGQAASPSKRCDFIDPAVCLYPWPNDFFTVKSEATATGRKLNLSRLSMPANKDGVRIDPADQNRADGFSPGSMLITKVPGLDTPEAAERSHLPRSETSRRAWPRAHRWWSSTRAPASAT
jgi:hypothetical protein